MNKARFTIVKAGSHIDLIPALLLVSRQIEASFVNEDVEGASLYFSAEPWASGQWNVGQVSRCDYADNHRSVCALEMTLHRSCQAGLNQP